MVIYFSDYQTMPEISEIPGDFRLLTSYPRIVNNLNSLECCYSEKRNIKITKPIFLDSGAFSVFTGKISIGIKEYGDFLLKYKDKFCLYSNLDIIGDAEETKKNQEYLEEQGLNPLPTFHYGSSYSFLKEMKKNINT